MNSYSSIGVQERLMIRNQLHSTFPIIQAVIEGVQQGQIFRNARKDYWVLHKAGFSEVFFNDDDGNELVDFIMENNSLLKYFHIYNPPEKLVGIFKTKPEIFNIRERGRMQLKYEDRQNSDLSYPVQNGYTSMEVTRENIDLLTVFNLDLANKFWNGNEDFVKNALGVFIQDEQNNPVSLCYAAAVADQKAEIDVVTSDQHRGKGLAKSVVATFIENCVSKKIIPNWDCFKENLGSLAIALKLGFIENKLYNFVSVYRK